MSENCRQPLRWEGEYEGYCELPEGHGGLHFNGVSRFNDDNEVVELQVKAVTGQRWTLTLQDPDDPYRFSVRARQLSASRWDAEYLRAGEVHSTAHISTPPPHMPPMATLMGTLQDLRHEAEYWARRAAADMSPGRQA